MQEIINQQRLFFATNETKRVDFRIRQLKKFEQMLRKNETLLNEAIYADFKKSAFDNFTNELGLIYHDISEAIKKVKRWSKIKRVGTNFLNFPAKSYVVPEPLGVSLVIGAWNYPYQLSLAPCVAAIAAGNTVVLKPSELPAETSRVMAKIIGETFDANYFTVVEGGIPETSALLEQKFDKIFFTGSATVGKIIYAAAAKHLTPVTLELGGKSPAIVTADCNLKLTVKRLVWAKYLNSGQTCIAPDYVLVDESIKAEFIALVKTEIEDSHYDVENGNFVQIINERNLERLVGMIDQEKVIHGGDYDLSKRHLSPTVMSDVNLDDKIMEEEIFGPILPIISYKTLEEALTLIHTMPKPLSCYLFTSNKKTRNKILNEVSFGGGAINDAVMHILNSNMGFGGVGESGIGAYHGENGFKTFTHYKGILDKKTWLELSLKYYPHTPSKLKWIKRFMKL